MAFQHTQKSSHALSEDTLKLLEEIDAFPYALIQPKFNTLGDLHNTLTVEVVDKVERKIIIVRRTIGEIKRRIAELEKEELQILAKRNQMLEDMRRRQDWSQERFLPAFEHQWELKLLKRALDDNSNKPDDYPVSIEVPIYRSGYYTRSGQDAKVVLVYDNKEAIAITYIHEMMHAYYDSDRVGNAPNSIEFAEEPLAEYGMLHFLETFSAADSQYLFLFLQAIITVRKKQKSMGLAHYGFGEYLFGNYAHLDWEAMMLAAKNKVSVANPDYLQLQRIFQSGYLIPQQLPAIAQLLYEILLTADGQPSQVIAPIKKQIPNPYRKSPSQGIVGPAAIAPEECNEQAIEQIFDLLPQDLFESPDITFCDPYYLSRTFVEVAEKRLAKGLSRLIPDQQARLQHIREKQIFHRKPNSDVLVFCDDMQMTTRRFMNGRFRLPDGSYYQNLLGDDCPHQQFDVVMGVPPFKAYDQAGYEIRFAWESAIMNGITITRHIGLFCTPADWYYYGRSRFLCRRNYIHHLMQDMCVIRDYENSMDVFPSYPRVAKGVSAICLDRPSGGVLEISFISSDGTYEQRGKFGWMNERVIFRNGDTANIFGKMRYSGPLSLSPVSTPYSITLNRILKRVNGEWRLTRVPVGSSVSKSITFDLDLPPTITPQMVDAFFESALATFIVMEYSGISRYSIPEVKKYAFEDFPGLVQECIKRVISSSAIPQIWDDNLIFDLFDLTPYECRYIHDRLR